MRTLLLFLALALPTAACADTVRYFNLTSTFQTNGYSPFTINFGTIAIDTTTGGFNSSKLTYNGIPLSESDGLISELFVGIRLVFSNGYHQLNFPFDIYLPVNSLVDYAGGPICSDTKLCQKAPYPYSVSSSNDNGAYATTGSLTPLSATPEPSSLLLLGTGALSLIGIARGKLRSS